MLCSLQTATYGIPSAWNVHLIPYRDCAHTHTRARVRTHTHIILFVHLLAQISHSHSLSSKSISSRKSSPTPFNNTCCPSLSHCLIGPVYMCLSSSELWRAGTVALRSSSFFVVKQALDSSPCIQIPGPSLNHCIIWTNNLISLGLSLLIFQWE